MKYPEIAAWECGVLLRTLMTSAVDDVVIAAPFIRSGALRRVVEAIPDHVRITCVTRWLLDDFVAGVADLSPWYQIQDRLAPGRLLTRPDLHAKYYRADRGCLVGSANVTGAALGWSKHPNLELLVPVDAEDPRLAGFEEKLIEGATLVDEEYVELLEADLQLLPAAVGDEVDIGDETESGEGGSEAVWIPGSRHPENVWVLYSGGGSSLTERAALDARADLRHLLLPVGLGKKAFVAGVRIAMRSEPIVQAVDDEAIQPRRFGEMRQFVSNMRGGDASDAAGHWQTLMRWLLHFYPERYQVRIPGEYSEVFSLIPDRRHQPGE